MANFTKAFHHKPYAVIDPSLPTSSCKGQTILITGASEGIGYAIAEAFGIAQASQVIIVGRRSQLLDSAVTSLTAKCRSVSATQFIPFQSDVFDRTSIGQLWKTLADRKMRVDGLVLNAAKTHSDGDVEDDISSFMANVIANMLMLDFFLRKQLGVESGNEFAGSQGKFVINISSMAVHWNPAWPGQQAYCASKAAFSSYVQHLADQVKVEDCLMLNLHPGAVYTPAAERHKVPREALVWDDVELVGAFCVWLSKQAFLHGRFLWTNWDAEELIEMKHKILDDHGMLKVGLQGVEHVAAHTHFELLRRREGSM